MQHLAAIEEWKREEIHDEQREHYRLHVSVPLLTIICGKYCLRHARHANCERLGQPQRIYESSRSKLAHLDCSNHERICNKPQRECNPPCSQTSNGGPLQRTVLSSSSLRTSTLSSGFGEVYMTHVEFPPQALLGEHRFLQFLVITGIGSRQRSTFVVERGNGEKQATPSACGTSLEQQSLGWPWGW